MSHDSTLPQRGRRRTALRKHTAQRVSALPAVPATPTAPQPTASQPTAQPTDARNAARADTVPTHVGFVFRLRAWIAAALAPSEVRQIAGIFAASRLGFLLVTYVGYILLLAPKYSTTSVGAGATAFSWNQWDAVHYLDIAQHGYTSATSTAFFPLYPLLIHWLALPFGAGGLYPAALIISNLAFLGALLLLYAVTQPLWGRRVAMLAVVYLALFPTALYTFAPYNESLFLLTSLGCFAALQRRRWALAGAMGGLAALTRAAGVILVIPYALAWLNLWWEDGGKTRWQAVRAGKHTARPIGTLSPAAAPTRTPSLAAASSPGAARWRERLLESARALLPRQETGIPSGDGDGRGVRQKPASSAHALGWALLIPVGLGLFAGFCALRFGDPLAFSHAQAAWNRVSAPPWADFAWQLQGLITAAPASFYQVHDLLDLAAAVFAVGMLVVGWRRLPVGQTLYLAALLLLVLTVPGGVATHLHDPMTSVSRFTLEMFPAFIVLALLTVDRPRWREGILICSTMLLATLSLVFILGRWLV